MKLPSAPMQSAVNADLKSTRGTRLQGRWLAFLRLTWIILSVLALILFFVSLPVYFASLISAVDAMAPATVTLTVQSANMKGNPIAGQWLYDLGFLSFVGTMGVFLIGSLIWMVAVLLDRNGVFPRWFGYLNLINALTEVVIAPSWIFQRGVLAYNGAIGFWVNVPVFGIYTVVFIVLLRDFIQRDDLGTGPLPNPPFDVWRRTPCAVAPVSS